MLLVVSLRYLYWLRLSSLILRPWMHSCVFILNKLRLSLAWDLSGSRHIIDWLRQSLVFLEVFADPWWSLPFSVWPSWLRWDALLPFAIAMSSALLLCAHLIEEWIHHWSLCLHRCMSFFASVSRLVFRFSKRSFSDFYWLLLLLSLHSPILLHHSLVFKHLVHECLLVALVLHL